jgi:hypothetical protein
MKNRLLLFVLLLIPAAVCFAQKDTCKAGIYINSLYDFKLEDKSFISDCWIWLIYRNDSLQFENTTDIPGSKTVDFSHYAHEKKAGLNWVTQKCKAEVIYDWDVSKFPFDKQLLRIAIESSEYDTSRLVFVADTVNSRIDASFNSKEWRIDSFNIKSGAHVYTTTYGDPELSGKSSYPQVITTISIVRNNSWRMLTKLLTGAYVAFFISCLVFFVSSENQDSRFGLCVGGLFAAIGNKYIVESIVPSTTTNTLMDSVHNLTFTFILLIVGIIIISLLLFESGDARKRKMSLQLDKWAFFGILALYIVINIILVHSACCGR